LNASKNYHSASAAPKKMVQNRDNELVELLFGRR
jgi:hypothetical protein